MPTTLRLVREDDADQIAAIYEPYARDTAITFVYAAPTGTDFRDRIQRTIDRLPWFVCERDGLVTGYAYASPHRVSSAYRWSVETTIYLHPNHHRMGIGTALYTALLGTLRLLGYHRAYAGVTEPNPASIGLHEAMGCEQSAHFTRSATSSERGETSYGWSTCWETPTSPLRSRWVSLSCSERRSGKPQSQPGRRSCANARRRLHALRTRA